MLQRLFSAVMVAVTAGMLTGCGGGDRVRKAAPATGDADATVTVADISFSPTDTTIRTGEAVAWVWEDARMDHDVVFDDGPASPRQRTGTWQRTFDAPSTYEYVCSLHPNMKGRISVE